MLTLTLWGVTCHGPESPQAHDHDDGDRREESEEENGIGRRRKKEMNRSLWGRRRKSRTYMLLPAIESLLLVAADTDVTTFDQGQNRGSEKLR
jgi:hypothetical protein